MKITNIKIQNWRNFRNVEITPDPSSRLVCLVGENGTGKTNVLELISIAAHHLGLSPSNPTYRGDISAEPHSVEVEFDLGDTLRASMDIPADWIAGAPWNGRVKFFSTRDTGGHLFRLEAGGVATAHKQHLAYHVTAQLRNRASINYLHLDANRAFPPSMVSPHEYGEVLSRDWESPQYKKNQTNLPSSQLYTEWIKYFVSREGQAATSFMQAVRKATDAGNELPKFIDHFESYKGALTKVLPHLKFAGIVNGRDIAFDSAGIHLPFYNLSGGERELAFLVGQIDRFGLNQGLLLIDEPELHLNPELIRSWVSFLRESMLQGQVWLSTHSLEAVEVAGAGATFVFDREPTTRVVSRISPLTTTPIVSSLARSLGTPAFSLRRFRFIFVEGEQEKGERERFFRIFGDHLQNRFIEAGNSKDVLKRAQVIRDLSRETGDDLRVGGIIDRDFKTDQHAEAFTKEQNIFVLPCHEVENLFLDPDALALIIKRSRLGIDAKTTLQSGADKTAGGWIIQRAMFMLGDEGNTQKLSQLRTDFWKLDWKAIENDAEATTDRVISKQPAGFQDFLKKLRPHILASVRRYSVLREGEDLWLHCMGKQVLANVSTQLGFSSPDILENQISYAWQSSELTRPPQLVKIQERLSQL